MGGFDFEFHSNYNTCGKIIWQTSQKFAGAQKLVQHLFWPAATSKKVLGIFAFYLTDSLHSTCISPVTPSHANTRLLCLAILQNPIQPKKIIYNLDAKCFPGSKVYHIFRLLYYKILVHSMKYIYILVDFWNCGLLDFHKVWTCLGIFRSKE